MIRERLFELQDTEYAVFQAKLVPTIERSRFIGVRVPEVRKLARELKKSEELRVFLKDLPHEYYDENILHSAVLSQIKDFEECLNEIDAFLPYVDNWAVCDTLSPKVLGKNKNELFERILVWTSSQHTYTCRFGLDMLMKWFLDEDFQSEYLEIPAGIHSEEYYVRMMIAWFFATALAKQWEASVPYIEQRRLDAWTHNKAIQKACESRQISEEQKEYLRKYRI